jgi:hypothetical protein
VNFLWVLFYFLNLRFFNFYFLDDGISLDTIEKKKYFYGKFETITVKGSNKYTTSINSNIFENVSGFKNFENLKKISIWEFYVTVVKLLKI